MGRGESFYTSKAVWKVLKYEYAEKFFELGGNKEIFSKLKIAEEIALCEEYMGKFPVISVSMKGINAETYEKAFAMAVQVIRGETRRFQYLLDSDFRLAIPNMEIRKIFTSQIMEFFKENVPKNGEALKEFCTALLSGDAQRVEKRLGEYLRRTVSIRDTFVRKQMKENFYHGILLGILGFQDAWSVSSNRESGDGYGDILVETDDGETGMILELKYAEDGKLDAACQEALGQVERNRYEEWLIEEGVGRILKYGIAFYKKRCRVMLADCE